MTSLLERIQRPDIDARPGSCRQGRVEVRWDDDGVEVTRRVGWRRIENALLPLPRVQAMQLSRSVRQVSAPWLERVVKGARAEPRTIHCAFASLRGEGRADATTRLELMAQLPAELTEGLVEHKHHDAAQLSHNALTELLAFLYQRDVAVAYAPASAQEAHAELAPPPVRTPQVGDAPAKPLHKEPRGPGIDIDLDDEVDLEGLRFADGLAPYRKGRRWGYVDRYGEWSIEPTFDTARAFLRGHAAVEREGLWGVIDVEGAWVIEPAWDDIGELQDGVAPMRAGGRWGYISQSEGVLIEPAFDGAEPFQSGRAAVRVAHQWGLIDMSGAWLIEARFDDIDARGQRVYLTLGDESLFFDLGERRVFMHGRRQELPVRFKRHGRYGFIAPDLTVIAEERFDDAHPFRGHRAAVQEDGRWGFIDDQGQLVVRPRFADLLLTQERLTPVKAGDLWGFFLPAEERFVIEPAFDGVEPFSEGIARVSRGDLWGFVNARTTEVFEPSFDDLRDFRRGVAPARRGERWGLVDERGQLLVEPLFDDARNIGRYPELRAGERWLEFLPEQRRARHEGTPLNAPMAFSRGGLRGFVQPDLTAVIEPRFDEVEPFRAGYAAVSHEGRWGFIDADGAWHIEPRFDATRAGDFGPEVELLGAWLVLDVHARRLRRDPFVDDAFFLRFKDAGRYGFIDHLLSVVAPPTFHDARDPQGAHAVVADERGRWGLIDRHGKRLVEPRYDDLGEVSEGAVAFCDDGRWGLLGLTDGAPLIEARYDAVGALREGLVAAREGDRWGYLERDGEIRVPFRFDAARAFRSGRAAVCVEERWGVIDAAGEARRPPDLEAILDYRGPRAAAREGGRWGLLDAEGGWIVEPRFDAARVTEAGFIMFREGGDTWGHIDDEGAFQIGPPVDEIGRFVRGFAKARRGDRWGLLDDNGAWQVEPLFDALTVRGSTTRARIGDLEVRVEPAQRRLLTLRGDPISLPQRFIVGGRAGFLLPDLSRVIEPRFAEAHAFTEVGLAGVRVGGAWGFIDTGGRVVIPPRFDAIRDFSRGMAAVQLGGLWGFINERGVVIIEPRFEAARDFHTRLAQVQVEGTWNFIDRFGNFVRET